MAEASPPPVPATPKERPSFNGFLGWLGVEGGVLGLVSTLTNDTATLLPFLCYVFLFGLAVYAAGMILIYADEAWGIPVDDLPMPVLAVLCGGIAALLLFVVYPIQDIVWDDVSDGLQWIGAAGGLAVLYGIYYFMKSRDST